MSSMQSFFFSERIFKRVRMKQLRFVNVLCEFIHGIGQISFISLIPVFVLEVKVQIVFNVGFVFDFVLEFIELLMIFVVHDHVTYDLIGLFFFVWNITPFSFAFSIVMSLVPFNLSHDTAHIHLFTWCHVMVSSFIRSVFFTSNRKAAVVVKVKPRWVTVPVWFNPNVMHGSVQLVVDCAVYKPDVRQVKTRVVFRRQSR
uniref:Uncharacterized protein n=1 Tax=Cacopsylla melanoneura TaxID=428564 RepID=A0A8D8ZSJ9_9HEMI